MSYVFISYSRKDKEFAIRLAADLEGKGTKVWIDQSGIQAGDQWRKSIQQALDGCKALVLIISPDSMASEYVEKEWQYILTKGKRIIPVLYRTAENISFELIGLQHIDFRSEDDYPAALDQLHRALEQIPCSPPGNGGGSEEDIPQMDWVDISAGTVTLEDMTAFDHGTQGGLRHVTPFAMAKFPVTHAQYQLFVEASDGYSDVQWWDYSSEAQLWRAAHPQPHPSAFPQAHAPRAGVSWYDAVAFCQWLSSKTGHIITLPTESQWQRAAQGDTTQAYPWGNEFDRKRCNSSIGEKAYSPTPVGQYPDGASPYGVMDQAGNVWEWCVTEWTIESSSLKGSNKRILRGGAWNSDVTTILRVGYRYRCDPDQEKTNVGFRCVLIQEGKTLHD